jgi:hypothetical protein
VVATAATFSSGAAPGVPVGNVMPEVTSGRDVNDDES